MVTEREGQDSSNTSLTNNNNNNNNNNNDVTLPVAAATPSHQPVSHMNECSK